MGYQQLVDQGQRTFDNIKNIDKDKLFENPGNLQPWNGLVFEDFTSAYDDLIESLEIIYQNNVLDSLPFNLINGMNGQLNNVLQHCNQFLSNKNQQHFQNAFQQVESLRTNIHTWGLKYLTILGQEVEEKIRIVNSEINNILSKKSEIDSLKSNVESLIEPAVAGSLSKSFSERQNELHENLNKWFWVSAITAVLSIVATLLIVGSIVGVFESEIVAEAIKKSGNSSEGVIWSTVALRLGILLPIYSVFGFSFMQYRKERDLEEEYAHKSAVATSLPNYGDLAIDDKVKDQILSEASKVIFNAPTKRSIDKEKSEIPSLDQLNKLIGSIQKLVPKPKE